MARCRTKRYNGVKHHCVAPESRQDANIPVKLRLRGGGVPTIDQEQRRLGTNRIELTKASRGSEANNKPAYLFRNRIDGRRWGLLSKKTGSGWRGRVEEVTELEWTRETCGRGSTMGGGKAASDKERLSGATAISLLAWLLSHRLSGWTGVVLGRQTRLTERLDECVGAKWTGKLEAAAPGLRRSSA